ncbi:hypothetical protein [Sulfitobacter sp. R18_1]|uniref:hypothetical protein n=1 Tax=Sulfitobacter sp. R18_1 TaxID=2821104 RepID=UPI001AD9ABEF|nr:hypothetical protein [Sulfitobacter sp. R18_1]MBO9428285.1 hypothetical protein [Sulfitobacter sp. R18_1]
MSNTIKLTSEKYGKTFTARFVTKGDLTGPNMMEKHNDEPIVEIYDAEYDLARDPEGEQLGQLVSTYYAETLLEGRIEDKKARGLDLHGGVENWTLDAAAFNQLHDAIVNWVVTYEDEQAPSAPAP